MNTLDNQSFSETNSVSPVLLEHIRGTTGWMKFLAIGGFVVCVIMLAAAVFMLSMGSVMAIASVMYVIIALLLFMPNFFLFQYANRLNSFSDTKNPAELESAFSKQQTLFIFLGIMMILYLLVVAIAVIAAITAGSSGLFGRGF